MLIKCESLSLLPCRMGVIKEEGDDAELKIQNQGWGDNYITVLSEAIKHNNAKDLHLSHNRIH